MRNGYEIVIAVDGQERIAKALSEKSSLILMDMSLPVIDGLGGDAEDQG